MLFRSVCFPVTIQAEGRYGIHLDEMADLIDDEDFFDAGNTDGLPVIAEELREHIPVIEIAMDENRKQTIVKENQARKKKNAEDYKKKKMEREENNVSIEYLETLGKLHDKWLYQDTSNYIIVEHREHLANKPVEVLDNDNTQLQKQIAFIPSLLEMLDHASAFTTVYKEKSHELDV